MWCRPEIKFLAQLNLGSAVLTHRHTHAGSFQSLLLAAKEQDIFNDIHMYALTYDTWNQDWMKGLDMQHVTDLQHSRHYIPQCLHEQNTQSDECCPETLNFYCAAKICVSCYPVRVKSVKMHASDLNYKLHAAVPVSPKNLVLSQLGLDPMQSMAQSPTCESRVSKCI